MSAIEKLRDFLEAFEEECRAGYELDLRAALGKPRKAAPRTRVTNEVMKEVTSRQPSRTQRAQPAQQATLPRRDPTELQRITDSLLTYIKDHPSERIEQISDGMGVSTKELKLPMRYLKQQKQVTQKGERRAATYAAKG